MNIANQTVLVTGGGGFLGSYICAALRSRGCARIFAPRKREYDLTRSEDVEQLFRKMRPEIVIHAAALVGGIGANRVNPGKFFYDNAMMGIQIIEAARRFGSEKIVVLGTICSYPKSTPVPFHESNLWDGFPEETNAPYGIAKKALLIQCQAYRQQYGMNAIFLLPVNLYGPGDNFDLETSHVIPALIRKSIRAAENGGAPLVCWGDGSPTREFLYVKDAADGIVAATERYNGADPVNLGSGEEISIRELTQKIATLTGFGGEIVWDESKPNGQPRRCLDITRAECEFGFRARTSLDHGLRETIAWYGANSANHGYVEAAGV
jgi:GDP-L-fucose synthase